MNQLGVKKRSQIVHYMLEGTSLRAICRLCEVAKGSVIRLLLDLGDACLTYQAAVFKKLPSRVIFYDRYEGFIYSKEVPITSMISMCEDSRLVPYWAIDMAEYDFINVLEGLTTREHTLCIKQNLRPLLRMKRFTKLTTAFSRKLEHHNAALAINFMFYNFCKGIEGSHVTPAMAAGLDDHKWSIEEMIDLLDDKVASLIKEIQYESKERSANGIGA